MATFKIFQIYYEENQRASIYKHDSVCGVYNPAPSTYNFEDQYYTFENKIIAERVNASLDSDYVGVWSHKHYEKLNPRSYDGAFSKIKAKEIEMNNFMQWMQNTINKNNFDVLGFHRMYNGYHKIHMIEHADKWHKNFKNALTHLIQKANVSINIQPPYEFVSLMNYQVARTDIYIEYVETVLKPIMNAMQDNEDKQLQEWLFTNADYKGEAFYNRTLQNISGTNHYTLHAFILERLFTLFINKKGLNCINY